jgi:hypothetical protein
MISQLGVRRHFQSPGLLCALATIRLGTNAISLASPVGWGSNEFNQLDFGAVTRHNTAVEVYDMQRTSSLTPPIVWTPDGRVNADANGLVTFRQAGESSTFFWRAVSAP